jgi:ketosteroid isomerase-like protein
MSVYRFFAGGRKMSRHLKEVRHIPVTLAILAITIAAPLAQSTGVKTNPDTGAEQAVTHQEALYADAVKRQDVTALQTILADDFLATSSRGEVRNRAMELDDIKPTHEYSIDDFRLDDVRVRVFDNTAIVIGRQILEIRYNRQPLTTLFRYTRVYVKRGDRWQAVAQQLTALPQQAPR